MISLHKRPLMIFVWLAVAQAQTAPETGDPTTSPTDAPTDAPSIPVTSSPTKSEWGGCVDPNNPDALVTIGRPTTICLVIADGPDWSTGRTFMRLNFQPKADEYSRFHVPQSYKQLVVDTSTPVSDMYSGKNITVSAASQNALSFQKRYYDGFDKIFPHLTAVVDVIDGVVAGIAWDDACIFCGKSECERNTFDYGGILETEENAGQPVGGCYLSEEVCNGYLNEERTDCDLILYVVWTGTDTNGNSFQSSSYRFSAFPAQELSDRFSQNLPDFDIPDLNPLND